MLKASISVPQSLETDGDEMVKRDGLSKAGGRNSE